MVPDEPEPEQNNHEPRQLTRSQKRRFNEINHISKSIAEMDPITAFLEKDYEEKTKIKYITTIVLGSFQIDTWYYSPYPNEYEKLSVLFICESCLKYMASENIYTEHQEDCQMKKSLIALKAQNLNQSPSKSIGSLKTIENVDKPDSQNEKINLSSPVINDSIIQTQNKPDNPFGRLIYNDNHLYVFEIDGSKNKLYCQNLCLMAKLFLYHKTLYFDVSAFYFYVLYEFTDDEFHIASYFSKEKNSLDNYNVACILTFPPHQRKGYGKFLIALSYELSKRENKVGTPERPLSDLGHALYRSYWAYLVLDVLRRNKKYSVTVNEISEETGMTKTDIVDTLQLLNMLKYWKGNYISSFSSRKIDRYFKNGNCKPPSLMFKPDLLKL